MGLFKAFLFQVPLKFPLKVPNSFKQNILKSHVRRWKLWVTHHCQCPEWKRLKIQCVFFHRSSEIGLLWACFGTSGLPKGFQVTTRLGANYLLVRNIIWWVLEIFRKMIVSRKNFRISQFKQILKDVPEMISSFLFHF